VKGYKGFDKNLQCRDKQYEVGKTYEELEAELCKKGLHFCENPLDCFGYYPPTESRFAETEADDVSNERGGDSKRVAKKIFVKAELSIFNLVKAAVEIIIKPLIHAATTGDRAHAATTGNDAHAATTGDRAQPQGTSSVAASVGTVFYALHFSEQGNQRTGNYEPVYRGRYSHRAWNLPWGVRKI
jgi:hypothetical protein